ncbi:MAG: hypothetical protein NW207_06420 [Cytophagales bacterium]|nr:hypothetical protein [Cytophagales bacterium]
MLDRQEVHILVGCADARDLGQIHLDAVYGTIDEFKKQNIDIEFHVIRTPGSFVTKNVFMDIKRTIESNQRSSAYAQKTIDYYVHIQSHGELNKESDHSYVSHIYDTNIVQGSVYNCGMLNATAVAIEIEKMLIEASPTIMLNGKEEIIDSEAELRHLLREYYAYDGYLAGDWIKSIDNLQTHCRAQRTQLEHMLSGDPDLNKLHIKVTAGIQDYSIHSLVRLDGGKPKVKFWDDVQQYIRHHDNRDDYDALIQQAQSQKPYAGLLCMSDPRMSSRPLATRYYLEKYHNMKSDEYTPNTIFNLSGSNFDMPLSPFGPYTIAGFFYAVKYLGLIDQIVVGKDDEQTLRIMKKIDNDPIMKVIVDKFKVNLIPISNDYLKNKYSIV